MEFRVLGSLEVHDEGSPVGIGSAKQRQLLAALLVDANSVVSADRLADILWGDAPPADAAGALQTYVSRLRATLEPARPPGEPGCVVVTQPPGYTLRVDQDQIDAGRFEHLLNEGRRHGADGDATEAAATLDEALQLWRGRAFAEFADEDFARTEALRLDELRCVAIDERVEAKLRLGCHQELVGELEGIVAADPLRERPRAQLMLALYRCGREAEALRAYQEFRRYLADELGIEPSRDLASLEEAILLQKPELDWQPPASARGTVERPGTLGDLPSVVPLPVRLAEREPDLQAPVPRSLGAPVFVGRETPRAALTEALKHVEAGDGRRVVLVAGEAGIGKTALISMAARDAHAGGAVVLYGRCDEELGIPYQPWTEALGELVDHAPESLLRAHVMAAGGDLVGLVPELGRRLGPVPAARSSDRDAERHLLFGAVLDLLTRISSRASVLLVLDDLQWADRPSLQLLRHVVAGSMGLRLLVLGTFRAGAVGADDAWAEVLASLHRERGVERLSLQGLDDQELLALLQTIAGHELTDKGHALRDALQAETDGNPFFVLEILRHLAETGGIAQDEDGRWVAHMDLSTRGLPVSVREVIGRRAHRLGPEATRVLSAAAVIGRDFDPALLSAVADIDEDELLDILDAAAGAALIVDAAGMPGRFTFVHALIQRALYDELSTARRQRLHRRVGEALEALPGGAEDRVGELAQHLYTAAQPADLKKTLQYSTAAGDRAQRHLAPEEAVRWYTQALELLDRLAPHDQDQRCQLWLRLGAAQRLAGMPEFRRTLLDAAQLARRLGDTDRLVEAALTNTRRFAAFIGRLDVERIDVLRAALDAVGTTSPETRARLLAQWAAETIYGPAYDTDSLIHEALDLTDGTDDLEARGRSLYALFQQQTPQNLDTLRAFEQEYLDVAALVDPSLRCLMYGLVASMAIQSGDLKQARAFLGEHARLVDTVGDPTQRWQAQWLRASLALLEGNLASAEEHTNAALQLATENGEPDAMIMYGAQLFELRTHQGREAEICDLIAQTATGDPGLPGFRARLASVLAASHRQDEATVVLDEMTTQISTLWVDPTWSTTLSTLAHAAGPTHHRDIAHAIVPLLAPYTDQWAFNGANDAGPIAQAVGILRTVLGNYDEAEADFATAMKMAENAHCPYHIAATALEWAIMLIDRAQSGDLQRANGLLKTALEHANVHRFDGLARRARALDDRLARPEQSDQSN
jgi:DNA-binding SARP family transcriptional activator